MEQPREPISMRSCEACHVNQATRFVNDRLICDSEKCEKVAEETQERQRFAMKAVCTLVTGTAILAGIVAATIGFVMLMMWIEPTATLRQDYIIWALLPFSAIAYVFGYLICDLRNRLARP